MRPLATHRPWILSLLLAALCVVFGAPAEAQVDSTWDHYKVYEVANPPSGGMPVFLQDQFGQFNHSVSRMRRFANPVEKRVPDATGGGPIFPINDSLTHYTWWDLNPQPMDVNVRIDNQFGFQNLRVLDGLFLLNPALKNQPTNVPLPNRNHYKCYLCEVELPRFRGR